MRLYCQHCCGLVSPTPFILYKTCLLLLFLITCTILFVFILRLTSVAGDKPHIVPFRFFDRHKQRGSTGHQYGHVTGRPREFCVEK